MRFPALAILPALLSPVIPAQTPQRGEAEAAVLENRGKPIVLPIHCTDDDMHWAGLSCTEQDPCPVYLELATAVPQGSQIFAAGNLHSESVTLYSVLLGSGDGGQTWRELHERIRGAGLDHIQFAGSDGWISGESLSPLPQEPFFLITSDGGTAWRHVPMFNEPEPGSIQQFFFTSKTEGHAIVDRGDGSGDERYALYESPNGGQSWRVRQLSNRPLRLPRSPEPDKDWRLSADRATKSYRIERRQGQQWVTAASFAVNAGACKPETVAPPASDEPAPEAAPAAPEPAAPKRAPRK
jgi:hypothetical protein